MMYIMIALGGALGALSRFAMGKWVNSFWQAQYPMATMSINILGSFFMGIAFVMISERLPNLEPLRPLIMVGFLGAFTTFSTFSLEIVSLLNQQAWLSALSYLSLSCLLGVLALAAGIGLARVF
ncbi:fluoride efflux transporter CrcB [Marinomonas ostreistagni]|uniref:Fluoride-specific ion channel FluC n=1 Tax=Marinomonas ostreistagni TaxID=359209 RepID=A0ABS0ZCA1_9GAMM|nr:fluoride efflux transporter CrcB [Marinomonas ostreistagni]MBJ7551296.1 fluoride efflux transporter CrcB [Marinomonas ostreistagni]